MRCRIKKQIITIFVSVFVLFFAMQVGGGFYTGNAENKIEQLDKAIVKAYNAEPKRTAQIYHDCMELIECCSSSNVDNGDEWIAKARRVITMASVNEVSIAIDQRRYKDAYIWVIKGIENGSSNGTEGDYNIEKLYEQLKDEKVKLEDHFEEYNISYNKMNYSYTTSRNKHLNNKLFNKR